MAAPDHDLLPLDVVGAAVAAAVGDDRWRACEAALISGGKSNLTFELSSAAGELILRRPPSGELLPSAHDMAREVRVQRALAGSTVPVPSIVLYDDGALLGVPFYVMAKVAGRVIRDELPAGYADSDEERVAMADALVDVLADLHAIEPGSVGLADYGRPEGFLERQLRRWTGQWQSTMTEPVPAMAELAGRLARRLPESRRSAIVHGDSRLEAVLDWELSTLGVPLADLGTLLFYWLEPGAPPRVLTPAVTQARGFPG